MYSCSRGLSVLYSDKKICPPCRTLGQSLFLNFWSLLLKCKQIQLPLHSLMHRNFIASTTFFTSVWVDSTSSSSLNLVVFFFFVTNVALHVFCQKGSIAIYRAEWTNRLKNELICKSNSKAIYTRPLSNQDHIHTIRLDCSQSRKQIAMIYRTLEFLIHPNQEAILLELISVVCKSTWSHDSKLIYLVADYSPWASRSHGTMEGSGRFSPCIPFRKHSANINIAGEGLSNQGKKVAMGETVLA